MCTHILTLFAIGEETSGGFILSEDLAVATAGADPTLRTTGDGVEGAKYSQTSR